MAALASLVVAVIAPVALAGESASCEKPAQILNSYNPSTPGVTLMPKPGADLKEIADRIALKYHIQAAVHTLGGYIRLPTADESLVEKLKCEEGVATIAYNVPAYIPEDPRLRGSQK